LNARQAITTAILATCFCLGLVAVPTAASATLTCNQVNGAPSAANGDWAGFTTRQDVRGYYYHSCNNVDFVSYMDMSVDVAVLTSGGYYTTYCDSWGCAGYVDNGPIYQVRAHNVTAIDAPTGTYRDETSLFIGGTFSYGAVSGCGRTNAQRVDCYWNSNALSHTM
jgi:hypothetical protein